MSAFGSPASTAPKDVQVTPAPADTVQCLGWSPTANFICGGSWDNSIRCWEISPTGACMPKAEQKLGGPVLDLVWHGDGTKVFAASCDRTVKLWDLNTQQMTQVAAHDAPVKVVRFIPELNCIMTGSWDKTLRFWDTRSPNPVMQFSLPERCYAGDVAGNLAVVATADKMVSMYTLNGGPKEFRRVPTALKMQTRCVSCFASKDGFAVGSIEGRVAIHYADENRAKKDNFSFKCHREDTKIYCVNDIAFHPQYNTFATVGSDRKFCFWDKDQRNRLKMSQQLPAQITSAKFNADGSLFAYAIGYDWSMGHAYNNPSAPKGIFIHPAPDAEIKPKQAQRR